LYGWDYKFAELPPQPNIEVPTAAHRMIRFGVDGSLQIRPVTLYATLSYLHAYSIDAPRSRELANLRSPHLPNAVGSGWEARGAVGVRVLRWLEMRLSLQYGILGYNLRSLDGQDDQPAKVLDSYLSAGLGPYVSY
jgi:hypothetical protein